MATAVKRSLVLHFDINKTIIICDPVKGVQCDAMVNALLSEACWGTWAETKDIPSDVDKKLELAATWQFSAGPTPEEQPGLITYADLLECVLGIEKKVMQELKNRFAQPGEPGAAANPAYLDLQAKLRLPEGVSLPAAPASVGEGRYFIVPSFFNLLLHLEREGRDFRLLLRTFGIDTADVVKELNCFLEGTHPCFPDVPESLRRYSLQLPQDTGKWLRDSAGIHLTLEGSPQVDGAVECAAALNGRLFGPSPRWSMALQDYYPYWRECKEADDSGKLVFIDPPSAGAPHSIFFDDNIERDRAHIVDARDSVSGAPVAFSDTKNIYLVKSEPILAISDPDYFIKAVATAEASAASAAAAPAA